PDEVLPYMKKKYGDKTNNILCGMSEPTLFGPNDIYQRVVVYKNYGDGEYTGVYYLKKVGDSYKIDWALSQYAMGYRGYGIKRMQLLPDSSSHYLFDVVRASDFYNYGFSSHKNDMFSFDIGTNRTSCLNGYCYKNDSRVAEIYNYIVEKGPCLISCEARYTSLSENNNRFAEIENIKIIRCCDYVLKDIYSSGEYIIENKDLLSVL
ncbi:MAG: hypothetical protein J5706_05845, partial [Elusimicrobiales bacterium]|nr:hypothetical protein [Elusimicrobiales bacterium]